MNLIKLQEIKSEICDIKKNTIARNKFNQGDKDQYYEN